MAKWNRSGAPCAAALAGVIVAGGLSWDAFGNEPYPSTYHARIDPPTLIMGATILTGTGTRIENGAVLLVDGRVQAVGVGIQAPAGARIIDAKGRWVTPGLIDVHSHLGVGATPQAKALNDVNEMTDPVTANVWAEHSIWPQDPGFAAALAGGVTTLQILPGSSNLIGGRSVILKNVPAVTYQEMKFPGAPYGLKMACGENPKDVYGQRHQAPSTRMGSIAAFRQTFIEAQNYQRTWQKYEAERDAYERQLAASAKQGSRSKGTLSSPPVPPSRNLKMETLRAVLQGEMLVHVHCYRADDMATMLDLAEEFHFKITAFHHAVEAYKIADLLARKNVCAALWADWWGFKMEAYDGIQENIALVDRPPNGCAMLHSDSVYTIQHLNQEAAKAMARGNRIGLETPPERAIRWITSNPARALGLGDRIGSLEPGKMADVVIWNRMPFSVYALADEVFIDGALMYDRLQPPPQPRSDFLLGQAGKSEQP